VTIVDTNVPNNRLLTYFVLAVVENPNDLDAPDAHGISAYRVLNTK
jgi:hypothetical protein